MHSSLTKKNVKKYFDLNTRNCYYLVFITYIPECQKCRNKSLSREIVRGDLSDLFLSFENRQAFLLLLLERRKKRARSSGAENSVSGENSNGEAERRFFKIQLWGNNYPLRAGRDEMFGWKISTCDSRIIWRNEQRRKKEETFARTWTTMGSLSRKGVLRIFWNAFQNDSIRLIIPGNLT